MGKYSEIVKGKNQAGNTENQKDIKVENDKAGNTENQKDIKVGNDKAGSTENQKNIKVENYKAGIAESQKTIQEDEDMVNLSIKVPRRLRQKWVAESRLRGTTLTAIISDYLKKELGEN